MGSKQFTGVLKMMIHRLFLLVLKLSVLKCASMNDTVLIEDTNASFIEFDANASGFDQSTAVISPKDMFSRFLNVEVFHMILQYLVDSRSKMSKVSKTLRNLADETKKYRFYEGTNWDMPELANIWKFGEVNGHLEVLMDERKMITTLERVSENSFNVILYDLLIRTRSFKELVRPVLKYLVRIFLTDLAKEHSYIFFSILGREIIYDPYGFKRDKRKAFLKVAINFRFFDAIYDLTRYDPFLIIGVSERIRNSELNDKFYFDYFSWVCNNPSALEHFLKEKSSTLGLEGQLLWSQFCIQKRAPESFYVPIFEHNSNLFHQLIRNYLCRFSLITLDSAEMEYYHVHINSLIDRYFREDPRLDYGLHMIKLLNDIRYGPVGLGSDIAHIVSFLNNLILPPWFMMEDFIMAASKANKKDLVKELSGHPQFQISALEAIMEQTNPHSFKAYFDIIEGTQLHNFNYKNTFSPAIGNLIHAILYSNFKIISMISLENGNKYEIESAEEYRELGFARAYEIVLVNECLPDQYLKSKMFNDSAEAGAVEFARFLTENFGRHPAGVTNSHRIDVSYKFIQLLLANDDLIWMLRDRNIEVYCEDERISSESISSFRQVINPFQMHF